MNLASVQSCRDELTKLAQEGVVRRTVRRARIAKEFSVPTVEAGLGALLARGFGLKDPRKLLAAAGLGALHGIYTRTRKFAP